MTLGNPPPRNPFNDLFSDQPDGNGLFRLANALGQPPQPPMSGIGELFRDLANAGQASAAAKALGVSGFIPFGPEVHSAKALANALGDTGLLPLPNDNSLLGVSSARQLAYLFEEGYRSRRDWNDRFAHWQRPASVSEEGTIERAEANVRSALSVSGWLIDQGVSLYQQGSYFNNTNVRRDADIDLRLEHPAITIVYGPSVHIESARRVLDYSDGPQTFREIFDQMRAHTTAALVRKFGSANVVPGSKAIKVKGITGSRAMVDVVPCVKLHIIDWMPEWGRYLTTEGIAILGNVGWIYNYPDLHHRNGKAKRQRTSYRFKKVVRIFKALRDDMEGANISGARVPSFLVESLVHSVEDAHFMHEADDLYDRVRRVALRMREQLANPDAASVMWEINGVKRLFEHGQAWTLQQARAFVDAVVAHLGNA